jgi:hypothetical protein
MVRERVESTKDTINDIDASFIDVTICPSYHSAYKEETLKSYGLSKEEYRKNAIYSPKHNSTNVTNLQNIFESVTYDITELLLRVIVTTSNKNNPRFNIEFSNDKFTEYLEITTKYWPTYGRCYSVHPKNHVLKFGVWGIDIVARVNLFIYFGYPGQFMYPNSKAKVIIKFSRKLSNL